MTVRARIENLVRELLPPGRFWEGPEAERLVAGIAGALSTPATTIDGLFDAIQPETASVPVLRQYYDYLRGSLDCVATPTDEDDLRAAVVQLFRAEFAASAAGMAAMIKGFLPLVEIRESQETSTLPKTLPLVLEPTGRIYEIWYPSLQNSASQVECVARRYMRDGDALRMVTPNAELVVTGSTAAETLFTWVHGIPATLVVERALTEGGPTVEQASLAVATDSGTVSLSDLFAGLEPADNANAIELRWWFERDYGDGPIQITPTQNRGIVNDAHVIFETVTGLAPTYLWVGSPIDAASPHFSRGSRLSAKFGFTIAPQTKFSEQTVSEKGTESCRGGWRAVSAMDSERIWWHFTRMIERKAQIYRLARIGHRLQTLLRVVRSAGDSSVGCCVALSRRDPAGDRRY